MLRRVSFERHCYAKDAKLFATRSVRARRVVSDRATLRQASDTLRPSTKMVRGSRAHDPIAPTCLCGIKRAVGACENAVGGIIRRECRDAGGDGYGHAGC